MSNSCFRFMSKFSRPFFRTRCQAWKLDIFMSKSPSFYRQMQSRLFCVKNLKFDGKLTKNTLEMK